jgi:DNA-binding response OmpR family regulator
MSSTESFKSGPQAGAVPQLPKRILIVEDDVTMEPLWRYVIEVAQPGSIVEWLTSGEAAENRIRTFQDHGRPTSFDLIIADIFLNGDKTGLDLWDSASNEKFVLMSVLSHQRLETLAANSKKPLPSYLQKPLDPNQCIETVRALLESGCEKPF